MTRGNQREIDRARAQARNAKKPTTNMSGSAQQQAQMSNAEIMREKQRRAELKKQGIDPDADQEPTKKQYDDKFMDQYNFDYGDEEAEETKEETKEEAKEEMMPQTAQGKKGKKNK